MRTNRKRLKRSNLPNPSSSQIEKKSWSEKHAPLASVIAAYSTLLAVIIAGLGYYFTVIPLYQKAAVDELIAKREFELKAVQAEIVAAKREVYEQRRANFIAALERSADTCADILGKVRSSSLDQAVIRAEHENRIRLDVVVDTCLKSVLKQYDASAVLTEIDYQHISKVFAETGNELDKNRANATNRITDLPNLAATDSSVLVPVGEYVRHWDAVTEKWRRKLSELNSKLGINIPPQKDRSQKRLQYQIDITQEQIADDYRMNSLKSIRAAVRGMEWPINEVSNKSNK